MRGCYGKLNKKETSGQSAQSSNQHACINTEENRGRIENTIEKEKYFQYGESVEEDWAIAFKPRHWIHLLGYIVFFVAELTAVIQLTPQVVRISYFKAILGVFYVVGGLGGIIEFFYYSTAGMSGMYGYLNFAMFLGWLIAFTVLRVT